jgi:signal peptidase I
MNVSSRSTLRKGVLSMAQDKRKQEPVSRRRRVWNNVKGLATTAVFAWFFMNHVAQAMVVPTESMLPTVLVGDHFIVDKVGFPANYPQAIREYLPQRSIHRGDILAFWSAEEPVLRLIKRVVGVPGDRIEVRGGNVFINGVRQDEPFAIHGNPAIAGIGDKEAVTLATDQFFMMGDNRENSRDSRYFGPVRRDQMIGRPLFIYWSYGGPYPGSGASLSEWAGHYVSVAAHILTRTRWERTGLVVR